MFKNPNGVHEPIMMILRLKRPEYATQLENTIGNAELEAFVCEDLDDSNKLMTALRQDEKLKKINVVHSSSTQKYRLDRPDWHRHGKVKTNR
jgi:hypothetical protein